MQLKTLWSLLLLTIALQGFSQKDAQTSKSTRATVNVTVTNFELSPLKKAEVLFVTTDTKKVLAGWTDARGKFSMDLPAGSTYLIKLKTATDTVDYSQLEIPKLGPNEYFDEAIAVDIKYDPPRSFTLDNVHFDSGRPTLRPESFRELNEIAEYMKLKEDEKYEIAGHTDNVGKDEDNLKLSQQRADAVKAYLTKKGVAASRISAKGYGASQPVAGNDTPEGRQKNRRTEVVIL